ncbi:MAG: xylulokinase [Jatrophihabitans sp.]
MTLVAGVDSSTQSCKVVVRDAQTGAPVRAGQAPHPGGTEVHPRHWSHALRVAISEAGGLDDVAAIAVAAQQHGMVCLDQDATVVRPALLWNDTRSAVQAASLIDELPGGAAAWAETTGSIPLPSFTVTKLRWLAEHEPEHAARTAAVCLPHDWLTGELRGTGICELTTDRGDASGTGYWSPRDSAYVPDLLLRSLGHLPVLPELLAPGASPGTTSDGLVLGAGTGDNAAAALGLGARPGDVVVSLGTSGVVSAVSPHPTADPTGFVAGFCDASGNFLPLVCTLNAARVLDSAAALLGVSLDELAALALAAPAGADGLVLVPYLEGERTPNKPHATGALHGMQLRNTTREHLARAAVEGLLCGLADGLDALRGEGVEVRRLLLIGGAARSEAVRRIAPAVLGAPVVVPEPGEYVAAGAARQAAWALSGAIEPPSWSASTVRTYEADPDPGIREQYAAARELTVERRS